MPHRKLLYTERDKRKEALRPLSAYRHLQGDSIRQSSHQQEWDMWCMWECPDLLSACPVLHGNARAYSHHGKTSLHGMRTNSSVAWYRKASQQAKLEARGVAADILCDRLMDSTLLRLPGCFGPKLPALELVPPSICIKLPFKAEVDWYGCRSFLS